MARELSTAFRVGRYTCSISLPMRALADGAVHIETSWLPETPTRLTKAELREYRRGRDALLAEAGRLLGGNVIVAEV
jgi:hypothetical protein